MSFTVLFLFFLITFLHFFFSLIVTFFSCILISLLSILIFLHTITVFLSNLSVPSLRMSLFPTLHLLFWKEQPCVYNHLPFLGLYLERYYRTVLLRWLFLRCLNYCLGSGWRSIMELLRVLLENIRTWFVELCWIYAVHKISSGVRSFALDGVLSEAKPELLHLTDLRQGPNASGTKACIKDTFHATAAWESPGHLGGEARVGPQRTGGSCLRFWILSWEFWGIGEKFWARESHDQMCVL